MVYKKIYFYMLYQIYVVPQSITRQRSYLRESVCIFGNPRRIKCSRLKRGQTPRKTDIDDSDLNCSTILSNPTFYIYCKFAPWWECSPIDGILHRTVGKMYFGNTWHITKACRPQLLHFVEIIIRYIFQNKKYI